MVWSPNENGIAEVSHKLFKWTALGRGRPRKSWNEEMHDYLHGNFVYIEFLF